MKRIYILLAGIVFCVFMSLSRVQADETYKLNYTVLKYESTDVSIANDYFEKPIKVYQKNNQWYLTITVNHQNWITNLKIEGQNAVKKTKDSNNTGAMTYKIDSIAKTLQAKVKVDIDEEVDGDMLHYHNGYNITLSFDDSTTSTIQTIQTKIKDSKAEKSHHRLILYSIYGIAGLAVLVILVLLIRKRFRKKRL